VNTSFFFDLSTFQHTRVFEEHSNKYRDQSTVSSTNNFSAASVYSSVSSIGYIEYVQVLANKLT